MKTATFEASLKHAQYLDQQDPLREYRQQFIFPKSMETNEQAIYLCGNSLGLQPKSTKKYIEEELESWAQLGVEGHTNGLRPWLPYHEFLTEKLAKVVGALPKEVVAMNTLTTNLHLLLVSFYRPTEKRYKIVIEGHAFPSDKYAMDSQIRFHGHDPKEGLIRLWPRAGEETLRTEDILQVIEEQGDEIALVLLGGVNYYTGQFFELDKITQKAHEKGCTMGVDLAHAAGNIHLKLHDWDIDFAVWCHYKYINSGPGSIAGIFVHERHLGKTDIPRFEGWWGHDKATRFKMPADFVPCPTAEAWQLSNAPVFSMAPIIASLELFDAVGMEKLCEKSRLLTGFMEFLVEEMVNSDRISIITPKDPNQRGCQLSIQVKGSDKSLFDRITQKGVIADWREPDVIRVAPVPLYNNFEDVYRFVKILKEAL